MFQRCCITLVCAQLIACQFCADTAHGASPRVSRDLQVLYTFSDAVAGLIRDKSGTGQPLNLKLADASRVRRENGALTIRSATRIVSEKSAGKIISACRESNEITVEAWITPANDRQSGPARIISLSSDTTHRNITFGQDGDVYDFRLRTTSTSTNGLPSTATPKGSLRTERTHIVYTRQRGGTASIFLDGKKISQKKIGGNFSKWNSEYRLILANEFSGDRPWLGDIYLVAIYSRALSVDEVQQNFRARSNATWSPEQIAEQKRKAAKRHFSTTVAPLLARRCLECHDASKKEGGLDLSRKSTAMAGGEGGQAIIPGNANASELWKLVKANDMPHKRSPLTTDQKNALRSWIDGGAVWSLDFIDPAVYAKKRGAGGTWVQRLTVDEYIETVRSATGVDISAEARRLLPADLRADGFSNTAYNLNVDLKHVSAYAQLADIIVGRIDVDAFTKRFSSSRRLEDKPNQVLISKMGKHLLRGPLTRREVASFRGIVSTVSAAGGGTVSGDDFTEAMRLVIEAMLQSPRFVYRIENQQAGAGRRVDPYELASRLSYIIWGGPPDIELIKAADARRLDHANSSAHVDRMLKDPRARRKALRFASEWLNLARLDVLRPNPKRYPKWRPELAHDMRRETLMYFEEVAWNQDQPLAKLFNSQLSFLTPRLARHYGLEPKSGAASDKPTRYDLSAIPERGGLLTQGAVLTVGGDEASMVSRGLFIFDDLLRGVVNEPPPGTDTTPVPTKAGLTQRGIAEVRIASANCGGCHARFEPLAFGLEKYDGLGAFHKKDEHGNSLRDDGKILLPGGTKPLTYKTSAEFMDILAGSDRISETITWKAVQYALGRPLGAADAPLVAQIHASAKESGGTYRSLIKAIVLSDLVQTRRN